MCEAIVRRNNFKFRHTCLWKGSHDIGQVFSLHNVSSFCMLHAAGAGDCRRTETDS